MKGSDRPRYFTASRWDSMPAYENPMFHIPWAIEDRHGKSRVLINRSRTLSIHDDPTRGEKIAEHIPPGNHQTTMQQQVFRRPSSESHLPPISPPCEIWLRNCALQPVYRDLLVAGAWGDGVYPPISCQLYPEERRVTYNLSHR
jgi:hypothetical protein